MTQSIGCTPKTHAASAEADKGKQPMALGEIVRNGLWRENTIFVHLLGMCPLLGVTTSAKNGLWMGLATTFVLAGSNAVVSLVRRWVPHEARIPAYITIIAAFVTVVDMAMNAWAHEMYRILGLFIPLIVVNCAIMGRAEAFASKNPVLASVVDGLSVGAGFTLALVLLGGARELFAHGSIFGISVLGHDPNVLLFILPPGAFLALAGILIAIRAWQRKEEADAVSATAHEHSH